MICFNCDDCCTKESPCGEGSGDCDPGKGQCKEGLKCGTDNCRYMHDGDERIESTMDCCYKPPVVDKCDPFKNENDECCTKESPCGKGAGDCDDDGDCKEGLKCGTDNCRYMHGGSKDIKRQFDCCYWFDYIWFDKWTRKC